MLFTHPGVQASKATSKSRTVHLSVSLASLILLGSVGGIVFWSLERGPELQRYKLSKALYHALTDSVDFKHCHEPAFQGLTYCQNHEKLEDQLKVFFQRSGNSFVDREHWTLIGSFFFVVKLASTVGYGSEGGPATSGGKFAAMAFGLLVIPLFGYALLLSASSLLMCAHHTFRCCISTKDEEPSLQRLVVLGLVLLIFFWFGGALLFFLLEDWSYPSSLYFCFITLSTVGFGKEQPSTTLSRFLFIPYIFLALGISTGLLKHTAHRLEEAPLLGERAPRGSLLKILGALLALASILAVGAVVFPALEREVELDMLARNRFLFEQLKSLAEWSGCKDPFFNDLPMCANQDQFQLEIRRFFGPGTPNSLIDEKHWTPLGSALFLLSLASTVGYGAQAPYTDHGKLATVLMGLIAIPVFGYAILQWTKFIWKRAEQQLVACGYSSYARAASLAVVLVVLWLLGALIFWGLESEQGWNFADAMYFAFVTLSTVGFATDVPNTIVARVFTIVYIFLGLGCCAAAVSLLIERVEEYLEPRVTQERERGA